MHTTTDSLDPQLQQALAALGPAAPPGLSAAVVAEGRLAALGSAGLADVPRAEELAPAHASLWFSMSKIATATAVLRLVDGGVLSLDEDVDALVPGLLPAGGAGVRVRHLLQHGAGLPNPLPIRWVRVAGAPAPDEHDLVRRRFAHVRRLRTAPGVAGSYTNLGYLLLGEVVATATSQPFERALHELVLSPLGMERTGFDLPKADGRGSATGHQRLPRGLGPVLRAALPSGIVGERHGRWLTFRPFLVDGAAYGGLVGPVDDAARLLLLHARGGELDGVQLLQPATVAEMQRTTLAGGRFEHGLGWFVPQGLRDRQPSLVQHYGYGAGYSNVMRLHPDRGVGVVIMGNSTSYDVDGVADALTEPWLS